MRYTQLRAFHNVALHGGFSRAAAALNHPHVMAVYDWGQDEDVIAIGVKLLYLAALFQLFDGFQVVARYSIR